MRTIEERELAMAELFPLACGILVGSVLGVVRPTGRLWIAVVLSVVLGFAATVISGEFRIGWEYLLVDIPLVGIAAAGAYLAVGALTLHMRKPAG